MRQENQLILENLKKHRDKHFAVFENYPFKNELLIKTYDKLKLANFYEFKKNLKEEISKNLEETWIPLSGSQCLDAILFEYDWILNLNEEAKAYGIIEWTDFQIYTDDFSMSNKYDFIDGFECVPGLTLSFAKPIQELKEGEHYRYYDDIEELAYAYCYCGYIAIQEVFFELEKNRAFSNLNRKDNFMFLIGMHDIGQTPLLIKE